MVNSIQNVGGVYLFYGEKILNRLIFEEK